MSEAPKGRLRRLIEYGLLTLFFGGLAKALASKALDAAGAWTIAIFIGIVGGSLLYIEFADSFVDRARFQWQSAKWAGIAQVYPVAPYPGLGQGVPNYQIRDKGHTALVAAAKSARELRLLMVSGWRIIGCQTAPGILLPALQERSGGFALEALLLKPSGEIAAQRAGSQGLTPQQYAEGVKAVVWTLAQLRAHGYPIRAYFYEEEPIWQLVITELEVWMLCASRNVSTGDSPIYCLKRMAEHGLAFGMIAVWDRRKSVAEEIDLGAAAPPNWHELKVLPSKAVS